MAFDFPSAPTPGQTFTPVTGTTYVFGTDGWELRNTVPDSILLTGDPQAPTPSFLSNDYSIATTMMVRGAIGYSSPPPRCGRLSLVSATQLKFVPFNGDRIKINGIIYPIPAAGIAGLGNTNVRVNNIAGQNLGASNMYYVYATVVNGVVTADFHQNVSHTPSITPGNIGTEVMCNIGGSPTYEDFSLIGFIRTNGSAQFQNDTTNRFVLSWFNRRNLSLDGASSNGTASAAAPWFEVGTAFRCNFLTWADESVFLYIGGCVTNDTATAVTYTWLGIDGVVSYTPMYSVAHIVANGWYMGEGDMGGGYLSETFHYATILGGVNAGTCTNYAMKVGGLIRG